MNGYFPILGTAQPPPVHESAGSTTVPPPGPFQMSGGFRMAGPMPQFPSGATSGPMPFSMADGTRGVMMMQMSPQSIQITSVSSAGATTPQQQQSTSVSGAGRPHLPTPINTGPTANPGAGDFFNQLMQGVTAATAQMNASKFKMILHFKIIAIAIMQSPPLLSSYCNKIMCF